MYCLRTEIGFHEPSPQNNSGTILRPEMAVQDTFRPIQKPENGGSMTAQCILIRFTVELPQVALADSR
jgi:hypothetical protein